MVCLCEAERIWSGCRWDVWRPSLPGRGGRRRAPTEDSGARLGEAAGRPCLCVLWCRSGLLARCGVAGPFTCPICGNVYRHMDSFRCHLHVHAGKTQCHLCRRVFSRRTRLNAHLYTEHGLESAYTPRGGKEP